jgi:NADH-quinone oxidoreductase subunit G
VRIFNQLALRIPAFNGINYPRLAEVKEQWPIVSRADLYYGGTSYENSQGLGAHLSLPSQTPALVWPTVTEQQFPENALLAVPISILYDRGQTLYRSTLLHKRIPQANITLHPSDAQRLSLVQGTKVSFALDGSQAEAELWLNEEVPPGVALVPRSFGLPIFTPVVIELQVVG